MCGSLNPNSTERLLIVTTKIEMLSIDSPLRLVEVNPLKRLIPFVTRWIALALRRAISAMEAL